MYVWSLIMFLIEQMFQYLKYQLIYLQGRHCSCCWCVCSWWTGNPFIERNADIWPDIYCILASYWISPDLNKILFHSSLNTFPLCFIKVLYQCSLRWWSRLPSCHALSPTPCSSPSTSSQPLLKNSQGWVEGELGLVGSTVSQQQGARLGPVACCQQLCGCFLYVPASLLLVGQHVGAEQGVQGRGDTSHQEPCVQKQCQELSIAAGSCLLE